MPGEVTVDFGIDLGTTNSSIAVFHNGSANVIKSTVTNADVTPSVVALASGREWVGAAAKSQLETHPDSTFFEFKRHIGTEHTWVLPDGGRVSPEELSASVLKSLKQDAFNMTGIEVTAAIITVPAAFDAAQIALTRTAGELAGLSHIETLQEPIAAALAYGFDQTGDGTFLVFDLGGGTFDTALLQCRKGVFTVIGHRGDNDLGGGKWDSAIITQIVVPKLVSLGHELASASDHRSKTFKILKGRAEQARIELSRMDQAAIYLDGLQDDAGRPLPSQVEISLQEFEPLIEPSLRRATDFCQDLLKEATVPASSVAKVIMVGGPTRTPALRRAVQELGIEMATMVDPMTVVARGAAVYAASRTRPVAVATAPQESAVFQLIYDAMVEWDKEEVAVGLRLERAPGGTEVVSLRVVAADGSWDSGMVALEAGSVIVSVKLVNPGTATFKIFASSADGAPITVTPETFSVTRAVASAAAPVNHSIGVGVDVSDLAGLASSANQGGSGGETYDRIVTRGAHMPIFERKIYRTTRPVNPGEQDADPIRLHFLEGESRVAERNLTVGEIVISAENITRPLPANSEIEVVLRWEEGQDPHASAYIPFLDQQFAEVLKMQKKQLPDIAALESEVAEMRERIGTGGGSSGEHAKLLQDIDMRLEDARRGDAASIQSAFAQIGPLLDKLEERASPELLRAATTKMEEVVKEVQPIVTQYGTPEEKQVMEALILEARGAANGGSHRDVDHRTERIVDHYHRVVMQQPGFWIQKFQELSADASKSSDPVQAGALIEQGQAALDRQDISRLTEIVIELWGLFPGLSTAPPSFGIRRAGDR